MDAQVGPSSPKADWYADPTGRHQHRYWDGASWTDHVADAGTTSVDPLGEHTQQGEPTLSGADGGRNAHYEQLLQREFGLKSSSAGWSYDGKLNQDMAAQLVDPDLCLQVLQALRQRLHFSRVCLVAAGTVESPSAWLVCDSEPPSCLVASLDATAMAVLVASVIRAHGEKVAEYRGCFLLKLG